MSPPERAFPEAARCALPVWRAVEWWARTREHLVRVGALADAFVGRRSRGEKHPVHDFLFTYYSFSPAKLKQWLPPLGVAIEVSEGDLEQMPWLNLAPLRREGSTVALDGAHISATVRARAANIADLCGSILQRAPRFRCHGLHEWAMVYRQTAEQVRHDGYDLRMPPEDLARFVESQSICCSHYDAFRFFVAEARPMNVLQPTLESRPELEQGGCLHTNMDLYKWSSKLWPWVGSDLIGRAFALACEGRDLDMRASPYDLRSMGYEPVCIETQEGREEYEAEQRALAAKAEPLREELRRAALGIAEVGGER
ncbi:MAG: hypothetical protein U0984_16970 [Prosthecobacter sp.]|nr:hypothetical protein [Prosthecobacter sp.]